MSIFRRSPDFVIGPKDDPYLRRWWLIPRNRWFNVYLHHIRRPDDDRALHDHPWWNLSVLLKGGYFECTPGRVRWRKPGSIVFRRAMAAHRLELPAIVGSKFDIAGYHDAWTLFITGPRIREWGFHCPNGWVLWSDFVDKTDAGSVGRGCDQ